MIIAYSTVFSAILSVALSASAAEQPASKATEQPAARAAESPAAKLKPGEALTISDTGHGLPNGSSSDKEYLNWLVPTDNAEYGYTREHPVQIGGFLEGKGDRWSSQYFASLLGPNGEPTRFERVKSCCAFPVSDAKLVAEGFKVGFLDVYEVTVKDSPPVTIYVSLYGAGRIYAPKGFTTRDKGPN